MNVKITTGTPVTRPTVTPLTSTILDHATVKDNANQFGLLNDAGLWPSYNCLDTDHETDICPAPTDFKSFDTAVWQPGFTFSVYGGVQCNAVGLDQADMKSEMERVFRANEGKGIERALLAQRFVANAGSKALTGEDGDIGVEWDAPVDLTPTTAIPLPVAFALLEGYAASVYSGVPTLHLPRAAASLLGSDKVVWEGGKAFSRLGAKIAIGGGYDQVLGQGEKPDGEWEMYATGEVYVEKGEEVNVQTFTLPGDGSGRGSGKNGLDPNTVVGLVERSFRVAVDCFTAKVTGKVY